jgi:excisionase family DNA binding protein
MDKRTKPYSMEETAQALGVGIKTLYSGIALGEVPFVKIGKRKLIPAPWVERALNEGVKA